MPSAKDDQWFGGKPGSSSKAYKALIAQYGLKKGVDVYHALLAKRKALLRAKRKAR